MTGRHPIWVRTMLTMGLPLILLWAFVSEFVRGIGSALNDGWLEVRSNVEQYNKAMREAAVTTLTPDEAMLLDWLGEEDFSQYGECYGPALNSLCAKGLALVHGEDTETDNNFIAKGHGIMFRAVSLTDEGRAARIAIKGSQP